MASSNPYDEGVYPVEVPASRPDAAPVVNPYDTMAVPIGPDPGAVIKPGEKPYSIFNTVGRMATDAMFGLPDTANMLARGLNYGVDYGLKAAGVMPQEAAPRYDSIPYVAPIARKVVGVAELPEDAGIGRALAEGAGSAVIGGLGSAAGRAVVRGVQAVPEMASVLNPWRPLNRITDDALEASGNRWYKALDNLDVRYTPETGPNMATAIERGAFKPKGISETNAGQSYGNIDQLRNIDPQANVPYGVTKDYIVPRDVEDVRQALNRTRAQSGQLPGHREAEAAGTAIEGIDRFLHGPPASAVHASSLNDASLVGPVLANARGDTAAAHRLGFLAGTRDELGTKFAAKANASAGAEVQALRDRAARALSASAEGRGPLYGFSDYEKQLLENASKASWLARYGANAPKSLIGLFAQGGGVGFGASMLGVHPTVSGLLAAGLPATEYAAKKLADWGTRRAFNRAEEAVAARSPLAQSMGIAPPPTARVPVTPSLTRDDLALALMAPSVLREPKRLQIDTTDWN